MSDDVLTTLTALLDDVSPETAQQAVGTLSVALGGLAVVAPARTAAFFGVRETGGAVPLLVRMVGVRNAVAGLRTLQASDDERLRALQAGLALGVVDAGAVLLAARAGAISKRSAVALLVVLGAIAWLGWRASQD
jgi:hypothetical protein